MGIYSWSKSENLQWISRPDGGGEEKVLPGSLYVFQQK